LTLLEAHVDVTRNSGIGGELDTGAASCQKFPQLSVVDDIDGPVVFRQPFKKMHAIFNY
jgi:hypothetical protein